MKKPLQRSDLTTALLHVGLVAALMISLSTGFRMGARSEPQAELWRRWLDALLLQGNVERWHYASAVALIAIAVGYVVFLLSGRLTARVAVRMEDVRRRDRDLRWRAINRAIYWMAFALLGLAGATGALFYFLPGVAPSSLMRSLHEWAAWGLVVYVAVHVSAQVIMGGLRQVAKIFLPRLAYLVAGVTGLIAAASAAGAAYLLDGSRIEPLRLIRAETAPRLDGVADEALWQIAPAVTVQTFSGFGFQDSGETPVTVRAAWLGDMAYFQFSWPDRTRSQKHIPLIKTPGGWQLMQSNYNNNDENDYYEDKFAVMLAQNPVVAGGTAHLGSQPLPGKPGPSNGLGLHYTTDGSLADVWHWKGVRSAAIGQFDDNYFGPPKEPKEGKRYAAGYDQDPKTGGGFDQNWEKIAGSPYVSVKRLPIDLEVLQARMGKVDPNPDVSDTGTFAMDVRDSVPYSPQRDTYPAGTILPSVIYEKPFEGDRGDVSAAAQWRDGVWTIEAARKLDTGSAFDQPIRSGLFLWVAAFDHSQVRHTWHIHPLEIHMEEEAGL